MKLRYKLLLAGVVSISFAGKGHAQIPVTDGALIGEQMRSNIMTGLSWVKQGNDMLTQYRMLTNQFNQLVSTYQSVTSGRIISDIAPELGLLRAPTSSSAVMSDLGFGQNLTSRATGFAQQNRVYTPQGTDFGAQEIQRQGTATANFQAEAQCEMQTVEARQTSLQAFMGRMQNSHDLQETGAIQNRLQLEQAFLANERAKLQAMTMNIALASRVDQQRVQESDRQAADTWQAKTNDVWSVQW